ASELGRRVRRDPAAVQREVPFTYMVPARTLHSDLPDPIANGESVLVQGMIDCLVAEGDGAGGKRYLLIDFKTDRIPPAAVQQAARRYASQLRLYCQAIEASHPWPVGAAYVYFLHPGCAVEIPVREQGANAEDCTPEIS
ncbi:MAG TPA: PD-(D/E)XK nuclease family protein, partial [Limnochordia bacterium]